MKGDRQFLQPIKERQFNFNNKFIWWLVHCALVIFVQCLGNTSIPEIKNLGIVFAIMFLISWTIDLNEQNKEKK
jgi:hypothetical protein